MTETSSRILVDRTIIRRDGRPFFSFGPRVLLTPAERLPQELAAVAAAGFTVVGSPPCSPGTLPLLEAFFDAAEMHDLMVVLIADPRLAEHGRYMADRFRHRRSLHSYLLPPQPVGQEGISAHIRDRDSIRAHDLFHPIWMPLTEIHNTQHWLRTQDIHGPAADGVEPTATRLIHQAPGRGVRSIAKSARQAGSRPVLCPDLRVCTSDQDRELGVFADDPVASHFPACAMEWFPYLANFNHSPRRDLLGPDPEVLRLQAYDLIACGARGMLLDFYEAFGGMPPFSGRDRLAEATILAQEIAVFHDFFAEGRPDSIELDSGHPRLKVTAIGHGHEILLVLRMEGYEEDFFVDEAYMERTEISINLGRGFAHLRAWRMDFPAARQLEVLKDNVGSLRFLAGPLELTGLILLSSGTKRFEDLALNLQSRLQLVAREAVTLLEVRLCKVELIEDELQALGAGIDNRERLSAVQKGLGEARAFLELEGYADAYQTARRAARFLRQAVKYQMAKALSNPVFDREGLHARLRGNYYTLPRFYREGASETARAFTDLT